MFLALCVIALLALGLVWDFAGQPAPRALFRQLRRGRHKTRRRRVGLY